MFGFGDTVRFCGFGPSRLLERTGAVSFEVEVDSSPKETRARIRRHAPPSPGVYGMIDIEGELVYVGKSKSLRSRLVTYFSAGADNTKARRIARRAVRLVWEPHAHELAALVRELELIRRFQPRLNVQGQPGRRGLGWLCLGRGPAPHAYFSVRTPASAERVFGPFRAGRRVQRAARVVNECFRLRGCRGRAQIVFSDQAELFPAARQPRCLRHELGACMAPCAAACTGTEYHRAVEAAGRFLDGRDVGIVTEMESAMHRAARQRRFEQAAYLRDRWKALAGLADHLARLHEARQRYTFVYPAACGEGRSLWYLVREGQIVAVHPAPRDRELAAQGLGLLGEVYGRRTAATAELRAEDLDGLLLVASWFRRNPGEMQAAISPRKARRVCRRLLVDRAIPCPMP